MHILVIEYKNNVYKKLFERTVYLCELENREHVSDLVFNLIMSIADEHSNKLAKCPIEPGLYTIKNYKFDSKMVPPLFRIPNFNITVKIDNCSSKKWKPNDPSCFTQEVLRLRYVI